MIISGHLPLSRSILVESCSIRPTLLQPLNRRVRSSSSSAIPSDCSYATVRSILRTLRQSTAEAPLTPEQFVDLLPLIEQNSSDRRLVDAYVEKLKCVAGCLPTRESIRVLDSMTNCFHVRRHAGSMAVLREQAAGLCAHGVSSFSLDSLSTYMNLCSKIKVKPDSMFIKAICHRLVMLQPTTECDRREFLSYLVRLNKCMHEKSIMDIIQSCERTDLESLSLKELHDLSNQVVSSDNWVDHDPFADTLREIGQAVLSSRCVRDLLSQARVLSTHSELFKETLAACEAKLIGEAGAVDPHEAGLLLHAWGRTRTTPVDLAPGRLESIVIAALSSDAKPADNLYALSRLYRDGHLPLAIREAIVPILLSDGRTFATEADVESFVSIVESVSILGVSDPGVIVSFVRDIDKLVQTVRPPKSAWKLVMWWKATVQSLPADSVLPAILSKEYPGTMRCLTHSSRDQFVQPIPPQNWNGEAMTSITQALTAQRVPFTAYAVIPDTPLRAHFRVELHNGRPCYVILMREDGAPLQASPDGHVSVGMFKNMGHVDGCELAFVPVTGFASCGSQDARDLIARHKLQ